MLKYITKRLFLMIPMLIGISILTLMIMHLAPGDPTMALVGEMGRVPPEYIATIRAKYGLDQPIYTQLFKYIIAVLQGDLGYSFFHNEPFVSIIL